MIYRVSVSQSGGYEEFFWDFALTKCTCPAHIFN
jgi:hypothetical protein